MAKEDRRRSSPAVSGHDEIPQPLPRLLADASDARSLAAIVVDAVGGVVPGARLAFLVWSADASSARVVAVRGHGASGALLERDISAVEFHDADLFLRGGRVSRATANVAGDPILGALAASGSAAALPLTISDRTLGTLVVALGEGDVEDDVVARLRPMVDHAAVALDNLLLREEQHATAEYLRADTLLLRSLAAGAPLGTTLLHLAEAVERYTGGQCAIMVVDPIDESLDVAAAPSLPARFTSLLRNRPMMAPASPSGTAAHTGAPMLIADFAAREHSDIAAAAMRHGLRACVSVPIPDAANNVVRGTIDLYYGAPHEPDARERDLLDRAVHMAAIALDRSALAREVERVGLHDALTSLPNRTLFVDTVQQALARGNGSPAPVAIAVLDIDDFKSVNDGLGHSAGDDLLTTVARRLRACLRPGDTAARLGGDEFALLLENSDAETAEAVSTRVLGALEDPISLRGTDVPVQASIGIAAGPTADDAAEDVLRRADAAMRAAKADGKGCIKVFDESMHAEIEDRLAIQEDLPGVIERGELTVHYQPVVALHTHRIVEVEALVRWNHPTRGLVPPGRFIPIAEERGMIGKIGSWVLREALGQLRAWRATIPDAAPRRVGVNLSAAQLTHGDLVGEVKSALVETGLHGSDLTLEITETLLMEDTRAASEKLRALGDLGIHIAVDDFGSGYASLSYLKQFPIDVLKIDRDIIADVDGPPEESGLPHAIVKLGQSLGMRIVAEGIERAPQRDRLADLGCDLGQGYLFSKPLPAGDLGRFLLDAAAASDPGVTPPA